VTRAQRFAQLISRLVPHLHTEVLEIDDSVKRYTGWSTDDLNPGPFRAHTATTRLTVVDATGKDAYEALEDALGKTPQAEQFWSERTRHDFIQRALEEVARGRADHTAAAAILLRQLETPPPQVSLALRIYGISPDAPVRIAGVTFRFRAPGDSGPATFQGQDGRVQFGIRIPYNRDATAIVDALGDADRGPRNALVRVRVAMAALACIWSNPDRWHEVDFGFGDTDFGDAVRLDDARAMFSGDLETNEPMHSWLYATQDNVEEALRNRAGLRELVELAAAIPLDPAAAADLDLRLLRAATAISSSFSGTPAERLLWRWIAIEALLGDDRPELGERLSDNVAVLLTDRAEARGPTKREVKALYKLRHKVAHGASLQPPDAAAASRVREISLQCLERIAEARHLRTDRELLGVLERARYGALSLRSALQSTRVTEEP
jgi:hypothetical protein